MLRRRMRVLLPLLVAMPAAVAFAQDAPIQRAIPGTAQATPRPTEPQDRPPAPQASRGNAIGLRDVEARLAAAEADGIRRRAACMTRLAQRIDAAATTLEHAADADYEAKKLALDGLRASTECHDPATLGGQTRSCVSLIRGSTECDDAVTLGLPAAPPAGSVTITNVVVDPPAAVAPWGCQQGDPLCSDLEDKPQPSSSDACHPGDSLCPFRDAQFDDTQVKGVLDRLQPHFDSCYQHALAANAALAGELRMSFFLGADGHPRGLRVDRDTLDDDQLLGCFARLLGYVYLPERVRPARVFFTIAARPR